ncbi:MAG: hypothetical protein SOI24_10570 [Coriobacteriales bacterium]|jgi:hypothetical protein
MTTMLLLIAAAIVLFPVGIAALIFKASIKVIGVVVGVCLTIALGIVALPLLLVAA